MQADILVTGGSGKTGRRVAAQLLERGVQPRVATRRPSQPGEVRFDWFDPASFDAALGGADAAYLVAPSGVTDLLPAMRPLIDRAIERGVGRLVLLSASSLEEGGPLMGAVHGYLRATAPSWVVLRPTWFMQNFSEQQHLPTIRDEGVIYSATGDGKVAFIDADDIAAVAVEALTRRDFPDQDIVLTGPEAISYDTAARQISAATGQTVTHRRLTEGQLADRFARAGLGEAYAGALAAMDSAIAAGVENRTTDGVRRVTGRAARDFTRFAANNAQLWLSRRPHPSPC